MDEDNGWTIESLRDHIMQLREVEIRRIDDRFIAQMARLEERFMSQKEALLVTADLAKEAKASANEWRGAMKDRESTFLPREEFQAILKEWAQWREATALRREAIANRLTVIETRSITWTAALGIFFIIVQIVMFWLFRKP